MYIDGCSLLWHFLFETLLNSWHCAIYIATYISSSVATTPHPLTLCVLWGTCVVAFMDVLVWNNTVNPVPFHSWPKSSIATYMFTKHFCTYSTVIHHNTYVYIYLCVYAYPCPCVHQMPALKYHFKYICVSYIIYIIIYIYVYIYQEWQAPYNFLLRKFIYCYDAWCMTLYELLTLCYVLTLP